MGGFETVLTQYFDLSLIDIPMIFLGALLFLIVWQALERTLFRPYLKLIQVREAATIGADSEAQSIRDEAREKNEAYEQAINIARIEAVKGRLSKVGSAQKSADALIESAARAAQGELQKSREELNATIAAAKSDAGKEVESMAALIIEKVKSSTLRTMQIVSLLVLFPAVSYAASGGEHHEPSLSDTFKYWAHFIPFVLLMYWLLKDKIALFWNTRRETLDAQMTRGVRELDAARQELATAQARLATIGKEIEELQKTIARDTDAEIALIEKSASERAKKARALATEQSSAEIAIAKRRIREEVARLAIARAEERLKQEISAESDRALRQSVISNVQALR